ncbi:MAG: hypothetical protein R6U98_37520, partial [Pirellulaceae bacterium]
VTDAVGFLLALPLSRVPIRMAVKKYLVVPYIDSETGGFASGNVYIGGFPVRTRRAGPWSSGTVMRMSRSPARSSVLPRQKCKPGPAHSPARTPEHNGIRGTFPLPL